ncbi:MAG: hypothetical protein PHH77_04515 [Victivallaceae bacterium]|nr:hypothetical protein [Victivallaceae bacterium]
MSIAFSIAVKFFRGMKPLTSFAVYTLQNLTAQSKAKIITVFKNKKTIFLFLNCLSALLPRRRVKLIPSCDQKYSNDCFFNFAGANPDEPGATKRSGGAHPARIRDVENATALRQESFKFILK